MVKVRFYDRAKGYSPSLLKKFFDFGSYFGQLEYFEVHHT
jgi:hypothetical protein